MVKKAKSKTNAQKSKPAKTKAARPAVTAKAAAKYDQPGAPGWKKFAAPLRQP